MALDTFPPVQLYDLKNDPAETTNLQAQHPEKVEELTKLLSKHIQEGRSTLGKKQSNDEFKGEWKQVDFLYEGAEQ